MVATPREKGVYVDIVYENTLRRGNEKLWERYKIGRCLPVVGSRYAGGSVNTKGRLSARIAGAPILGLTKVTGERRNRPKIFATVTQYLFLTRKVLYWVAYITQKKNGLKTILCNTII